MLPPPPQPLEPEAWDELLAALERGPSQKHIETVKKAMEMTRNMATPEDDDYYEPETQRAIAETRRHSQPIEGLRRVEPRPPGSLFPSRRTSTRQGDGECEG